jgi:hypothetical protein
VLQRRSIDVNIIVGLVSSFSIFLLLQIVFWYQEYYVYIFTPKPLIWYILLHWHRQSQIITIPLIRGGQDPKNQPSPSNPKQKTEVGWVKMDERVKKPKNADLYGLIRSGSVQLNSPSVSEPIQNSTCLYTREKVIMRTSLGIVVMWLLRICYISYLYS